MNDQEAAARAMDDAEFAQKVFTGEEDYPVVRDAILADMYQHSGQGEDDTTGHTALDPRIITPRSAPCYVMVYAKMPANVAEEWRTVAKPNPG